MKALRAVPGSAPPVPHARPCLGREEEEAALRVLRSGRLAPGAEAARLEGLVARFAEAADAVALSSGTTALTLALRSLGLGPGDDVAVPSYACAALAHGVRAAGCDPLVCDIDPETLVLDPRDLERRAGARLRAVIVVHPFGAPARLDPFRGRGLLLVEDCAQALGASAGGRAVGAQGDAAIFSFAPTKVITCGGPGGALAAPQAGVVRAARDLAGHDEKPDGRPRVNGLMGDLHAAIATVQAGRLREFRERRAAIAARYDDAFSALPLQRLRSRADSTPIAFRYLVRVADAEELIARLNARGVMARRPVFRPLHRLLGVRGSFPATDAAHAGLLSLPIAPGFGETEIQRVIQEVTRCLS